MALKNLSVEEMEALSAAWVDSGSEAHRALAANSRLGALLPDVKRAHDAIHAVAPRVQDKRQMEIARLASEEDLVHDRLARGIHGLLSELAQLDDHGEELLAVRAELFPDGIGPVVQATYRGEASYASQLRGRLTPQLRHKLASIPLRQGHLLDRVEAWLAAADRLGALEAQRARLEGPSGESTGKQVVEARNDWVRVVNAFLSVADLVPLDDAIERMLFAPLRDAEATAEARSARRAPAKTPDTSAS